MENRKLYSNFETSINFSIGFC